MAKLLFNLRDACDDEVEEVFELLEENQVDFYQTQGGSFGLSIAGIWVNDDEEFQRARQLLDEYQQQRQQQVRAHYRELRESGQQDRLWARLKRIPNRMITFPIAIVIILLLSIIPFLYMY
ncbi:hypothetical protein EDC56_0859 [Sinobacterium caligoides]|uniref:Uncharacterized protein n=2 Tax=Sinobacterium caligoides TaxID=933926 RepID=A0A3N2E117_9GAMM|nr:hypothetical protein EDC56_0859 [Sinobacterium caligoides]